MEKIHVESKRRSNFTQLPNIVGQKIGNMAASGLFYYLSTLPPSWKFYKHNIQKDCNIGRDKLNNLLKFLAHKKLIEMNCNRDAKGKFTHWSITVLDGYDFKPQEDSRHPLTENQSTDENPIHLLKTRHRKSAPINNNKEIIKKQIQKPPIVPLKNLTDDIKKLELPEYVDRDEWHDFVDYRAEDIKNPLTLRSAKSVVRKLIVIKKEGGNPNIALMNSVGSKWTFVYNDNKKFKESDSKKKESPMTKGLRIAGITYEDVKTMNF